MINLASVALPGIAKVLIHKRKPLAIGLLIVLGVGIGRLAWQQGKTINELQSALKHSQSIVELQQGELKRIQNRQDKFRNQAIALQHQLAREAQQQNTQTAKLLEQEVQATSEASLTWLLERTQELRFTD